MVGTHRAFDWDASARSMSNFCPRSCRCRSATDSPASSPRCGEFTPGAAAVARSGLIGTLLAILPRQAARLRAPVLLSPAAKGAGSRTLRRQTAGRSPRKTMGDTSAAQSAKSIEREMARCVVAQICKEQGFDAVRLNALDMLSEANYFHIYISLSFFDCYYFILAIQQKYRVAKAVCLHCFIFIVNNHAMDQVMLTYLRQIGHISSERCGAAGALPSPAASLHSLSPRLQCDFHLPLTLPTPQDARSVICWTCATPLVL